MKAESAEIVEFTVTLRNRLDYDIDFAIEPWRFGGNWPSGSVLLVHARGPKAEHERQTLEIELQERRVTVGGWTGSLLEVFCDGQQVLRPAQTTKPDSSAGLG